MENLPEPLTPHDCDLRKFGWMPLDVNRLLTSETWIIGTADECKASVTLWCESWRQVPAASLPDDDRILAHLSRAGSAWKRIKKNVMKSWVKCSDGKLYHPVVAEKALESWAIRTAQANRTKAATEARKSRRENSDANVKPATFDHHDNVRNDVTNNVTTTSRSTLRSPPDQTRPDQERKQPRARADEPEPTDPPSPVARLPIMPCRNDPPGRWMEISDGAEVDKNGVNRPLRNGFYLDTAADEVCKAAKIRSESWRGDWRPLIAWLDDGLDLGQQILPAIRRCAERPNYQPPGSLRYFDSAVRELLVKTA